ncbi:unnamed protein product [Prunus armeniaca]|uniref:Uncharacterized protein n=1 Tax=Prunus armeniaca TaxID=36596 RepID=A0A6J5X5E4_PRUAR|nr:unnamed protein product [Prunus armeniaca]
MCLSLIALQPSLIAIAGRSSEIASLSSLITHCHRSLQSLSPTPPRLPLSPLNPKQVSISLSL